MKCEKNSDCLGENVMCISYTCVLVSSCFNSTYGCCDDGHTLAQGPNGENCPKSCDCHPAGKVSMTQLVIINYFLIFLIPKVLTTTFVIPLMDNVHAGQAWSAKAATHALQATGVLKKSSIRSISDVYVIKIIWKVYSINWTQFNISFII